MLKRLIPALCVTLVTATLVATPLVAAPPPVVAAAADMLEGTVINAGENRLIMQDQNGKTMHNIAVAENAVITRDGREARLENLMTGDWVKVTTEKRLINESVITAIDARSPK